MKRKIEYKYFVNSLRFTKRIQKEEQTENKGILSNISNTISSNLHFSNNKHTVS